MHPQDNFSWVPNCSLGSPECETKLSSNNFGIFYVKMYVFHGKPLSYSREWGLDLQIQPYIGFYLSKSAKLGVKLKFRHMPFFLWPDM